jgi:hypothetical protein
MRVVVSVGIGSGVAREQWRPFFVDEGGAVSSNVNGRGLALVSVGQYEAEQPATDTNGDQPADNDYDEVPDPLHGSTSQTDLLLVLAV